MSDSLQPHGLQHTRLPCPSLSPRVCPNSCPLSWWYHPTISSSATLFCLQPYPASGLSNDLALHIRWNPCLDSSKSNQYWPSWTVVELFGGCDFGLGHFLTFSSIISSCKEDKLLFCFLEGKKTPKGRALRFTVWKKAWKMTMQTRTNVYFSM